MPRQKQVAFYQNIAFPECLEAWVQSQYADAGITGRGVGMKRFEEFVPHSHQDP